jgi:phage portal protein BeeE
MRLLDALIRPPAPEVQRYMPPPWMFNGLDPAPYVTTTLGNDKAEGISDTFAGYASQALMSNTVIAAIERVRVSVFAEARFAFQRLRKGRPGDLFSLPDLDILQRPWVGGTTGDLLARMILDADLAGNWFGVEVDGEIIRLRPDWVEIVLGERLDQAGRVIGRKKLGYLYYDGGKTLDTVPAVFLAEEVAHFAPHPDPLANYRGMSWLTPVVREIQADTMATAHKLKFFENGGTANLIVKGLPAGNQQEFDDLVDMMEARHRGVANAYRTLYLASGADATVVGANLAQMDFKATQGAGETRMAAAGGVHPAIVGLSEGMQGSSLNAGNFGAARRLVADVPMRSAWRNAAGSLEMLVPAPVDARLWYDDRDVAFLREDAKDAADIAETEARAIGELVRNGYTQESARDAVLARNMDLLVPVPGWISVQMQKQQPAATTDATPSTNGNTPTLTTAPGG